jgi:hypothetical protein
MAPAVERLSLAGASTREPLQLVGLRLAALQQCRDVERQQIGEPIAQLKNDVGKRLVALQGNFLSPWSSAATPHSYVKGSRIRRERL